MFIVVRLSCSSDHSHPKLKDFCIDFCVEFSGSVFFVSVSCRFCPSLLTLCGAKREYGETDVDNTTSDIILAASCNSANSLSRSS